MGLFSRYERARAVKRVVVDAVFDLLPDLPQVDEIDYVGHYRVSDRVVEYTFRFTESDPAEVES